jgi:hypothetical protein
MKYIFKIFKNNIIIIINIIISKNYIFELEYFYLNIKKNLAD